jgi:hypothetical protein
MALAPRLGFSKVSIPNTGSAVSASSPVQPTTRVPP